MLSTFTVTLIGLAGINQEANATICPIDTFEGHAEAIVEAIENQDYSEAKAQASLILELTGKAENETN